jgi:hypothetical protein
MEAVYRYADAVEKDPSLISAQDRLVAAGDTALVIAMDEADLLERRDNPVGAAAKYRDIDRMLARVRSVGQRVQTPADYEMIRRGVFDQAIEWQMAVGHEAADDGRWQDARRAYQGARGDFMPSRAQLEASLEAETQLLLRWADVELTDMRPRAAFGVAQSALEVRSSPSREVVLAVRDLQDRALAAGTIVVAVPPVTAEGGVREYLGPDFEIHLDEDLARDHWTQPPLFVDVADPLILRRELRGLLRGVTQSPLLVGRALDLVGADLGVMIEITSIEVLEEDVRRRRREARIVERGRIAYDGRGPDDLRANNGRGPDDNGNNGRGPDDNGNNGRGPDDNGNNGRGPDDNGNNGRGPDDDGNNGRGPDDDGNNGRGPDDNGYDGRDLEDARPNTGGSQERQPDTSREPQTVEYFVVSGQMSYHVRAEVLLVDRSGREIAAFTVDSHQAGPFKRGEYDGNWDRLALTDDELDLFDPRALLAQRGPIEAAVMEELAVAIARGTFDMVLSRVP